MWSLCETYSLRPNRPQTPKRNGFEKPPLYHKNGVILLKTRWLDITRIFTEHRYDSDLCTKNYQSKAQSDTSSKNTKWKQQTEMADVVSSLVQPTVAWQRAFRRLLANTIHFAVVALRRARTSTHLIGNADQALDVEFVRVSVLGAQRMERGMRVFGGRDMSSWSSNNEQKHESPKIRYVCGFLLHLFECIGAFLEHITRVKFGCRLNRKRHVRLDGLLKRDKRGYIILG